MFMIAGLLLHKTPMAYMRAISAAARSTAGILVQFPFYAGIQLMMEHSGLGGLITEFFINVANKDTFPVMTFFSSALINFAVPSGGGHWVIQGPFVIPAAQALGADLGKSVMAIAYGEQWMNMAQDVYKRQRLRLVLSWDTDNTDLDLHVVTPDGEHAWYGNTVLKNSGALDMDVTTGYGPEIFAMPAPVHGRYQVYINYYGGRSETELTTAQLTLITDEGSVNEKQETFIVPMRNAGELTLVKSFDW